jgi:sugar lactone lactonase YvrE
MKSNTARLVIAACLLVAGASANAIRAESSRVVTDYTATLWADADGHPVGTVSAIVQDRDGYLWVGTTAGLFRFDGVRFTPWNQLSDARLPATWVSSLLTASDGGLWVGFGDQSILVHITGRTTEVHSLPGSGPVAAILQDREGALWAVAAFSLFHRVGSQWVRVPIARDSAEVRVHDVGLSRSGHLLVSTPRGLFEGQDGARGFHLIVDGYVWSAGQDTNGNLWVMDAAAGFKVGAAGRAPRAVADARGGGYRVMFDHGGHAWIGTIAEGLWRVRLRGDQRALVEKATLRSALFNDAVQSLFEDRDGNIWVGTTAGLHRLNRQLIQLAPIDGTVLNAELTRPDDLWASSPYGLARLAFSDGAWTDRMFARLGGCQTAGTRQERNRLDHIRCRPWARRRKPGGSFPIPGEFRMRPRLSFLAADRTKASGLVMANTSSTGTARVLGLRASSRRRHRSRDVRDSRQRRTPVDRIGRWTPGSSGA